MAMRDGWANPSHNTNLVRCRVLCGIPASGGGRSCPILHDLTANHAHPRPIKDGCIPILRIDFSPCFPFPGPLYASFVTLTPIGVLRDRKLGGSGKELHGTIGKLPRERR